MASRKRISSAKLRSVAKVLQHKAAARKMGTRRPEITPGITATGRGVVRFRASRVIDSLLSPVRQHSS